MLLWTFLYEAGKPRVKSLKCHLISWLRRSQLLCKPCLGFRNGLRTGRPGQPCLMRDHRRLGAPLFSLGLVRFQRDGNRSKGAPHEWSRGEPNFLSPVQHSENMESSRKSHPEDGQKMLTNGVLAVEVSKCGWLGRWSSRDALSQEFYRTSMVKFWEKRELLKAVTSAVSYCSPMNILQSH